MVETLECTEVNKGLLFERAGNFLLNSKLGRLTTAMAVSLSISAAPSLATPETVQAETVCTTSPGGDSTVCTTEPDNPPVGGDENEPGKPDKPDKPHHDKPEQDGNQLPLPRHHTNRYWATMILNEIRQGHKGRIKASKEAQHSLYRTRQGRCTPVEMVPGACVKLDKTLLETLYRASQVKRFRINNTVSANHVSCSDHYQGRGADLMRYNDSPPHNRSLLHIFDHTLDKLPGHHTAQLLGPGDVGHSGSNAHWHIGITGPNNICE